MRIPRSIAFRQRSIVDRTAESVRHVRHLFAKNPENRKNLKMLSTERTSFCVRVLVNGYQKLQIEHLSETAARQRVMTEFPSAFNGSVRLAVAAAEAMVRQIFTECRHGQDQNTPVMTHHKF
eukprot:2706592-Amphidinium_carterae.1